MCAGIADFLGVDVLWVRLAAVGSVLFSFSLTFWGYLALWIAIPARPELPMPDVSGGLRRELRRIDKLVRRVHRQLPARVADEAERAFDALKVLAGDLHSARRADSAARESWEDARRRLPHLLRQLLAASAGAPRVLASAEASAATAPVLAQLRELERSLRAASREAFGQELAGGAGARSGVAASGDHPELAAWRSRLAPLRAALTARARPQVAATLRRIEEKLGFLFSRAEDNGGPFDLRPFELRKIAFEYIPDAIEQYLALPAEMARTMPLSGGITAEDALNEQLIRLDHALEEMAASVFERDAQGLLIHGRFLRSKFADQPFRVDPQARRVG